MYEVVCLRRFDYAFVGVTPDADNPMGMFFNRQANVLINEKVA